MGIRSHLICGIILSKLLLIFYEIWIYFIFILDITRPLLNPILHLENIAWLDIASFWFLEKRLVLISLKIVG